MAFKIVQTIAGTPTPSEYPGEPSPEMVESDIDVRDVLGNPIPGSKADRDAGGLMASRVAAGTYPAQALLTVNARVERRFALAARRGEELPEPPVVGKRVPKADRLVDLEEEDGGDETPKPKKRSKKTPSE